MRRGKDADDSSVRAACTNATYVTLLSGERYTHAAACLPRQLQLVHSRCPLLLVYDDTDVSLPLALLEEAYGADNMLAVSQLKARYTRLEARNGDHASAAGRRLFATQADVANTHLKLWLWALPVQRAVFVDVDILILRNIDSLLEGRGPAMMEDGSPGLSAVTCKTRFGSRYFNSGLLVFTPSLRTLRVLLELARFASPPWFGHVPHEGERWPDICAPVDEPNAAERMYPNSTNAMRECRSRHGPGAQPRMMPKACEQKHTDQSVLNVAFKTHTSLPGSFNDNTGFRVEDAHVIHFVGDPKPWAERDLVHRRRTDTAWRFTARYNATLHWQQRCARMMFNTTCSEFSCFPFSQPLTQLSAGDLLTKAREQRGRARSS